MGFYQSRQNFRFRKKTIYRFGGLDSIHLLLVFLHDHIREKINITKLLSIEYTKFFKCFGE